MSADLGFPPLDDALGPVPDGRAILFVNEPGVETEPFLYEIARSHAEQDRPVLYLVTTRSPDRVVEEMRAFDLWPGDDAPIHFVDAYGPKRGAVSPRAVDSLEDPADPEAAASKIRALAEAHPDAVLLVESWSTLIDQAGPEAFAEAADALADACRSFPLSVSLLTEWPYETPLGSAYRAFDGQIDVRGVEGRILLSQYVAVERADWSDEVDRHPRLFKPIRPGGVFIYVPKIVVTGPYNAGKTTFVRSASDRAVSVDRLGTTVALDHGHATVDGIAADLFGTPGQTRFDPILATLAERGLGILLVVDASKPDSFVRAREMFERMWRFGLPAVVVANKQDLPDALSPEEVGRRLRLPAEIDVIGCVGEDAASSRRVLRELLDRVLASGMTNVLEVTPS